MKYSQLVGTIAALLMIVFCFLPWSTVGIYNIILSGVNGRVNETLTFGRQIIPQIFFSTFLVLLFNIPRIWAKRTNLFFGLINLSWCIKNFIIFSICRQGICPEKKAALYLELLLAVIVLISTLLPKLKVEPKNRL